MKYLFFYWFLFSTTFLFCDLPIIFTALPKSASVYIGNTLCHGLEAPLIDIAEGSYLERQINYEKLALLIDKKGV